ncbi:MAG TPA: hypothetical protein VNF99_09600 [Stellaceae bacterium]|nr:hypothetical protein [Stellaceae bacterium]
MLPMLRIETFDNQSGGNAFFKAVTHPLAARAAPELLRRLRAGRCAIYDLEGHADALAELYDFGGIELAGSFVQDVTAIGKPVLGRPAQPVTALKESGARVVFVPAFETERALAQIRHLLPPGVAVESLDALRLPEAIVPAGRRYLDPLNFATNFVFFREQNGLSTRLVTVNYWAGYGANALKLWLLLFDETGAALAEWTEDVVPGAVAIAIDSGEIRRRFSLPEFTGQLFVHAIGAHGHDVVKYALDTYGGGKTERAFSCTHDANSWPADFYAGLPAPDTGETVTLWVQNSQPCAIPAGAIALNLMGDAQSAPLDRAIPPFASYALDIASLLPQARWPQQIEIGAGKYMVRPRYEITSRANKTGQGHRRIAHVNVERTDLKPDPTLAALSSPWHGVDWRAKPERMDHAAERTDPEVKAKLLGKGFILPAPILPTGRWRSLALPTPMARSQKELPITLVVYSHWGKELGRHRFGRLQRRESVAIDVEKICHTDHLEVGGHMELLYDLADGGEGDGWLHALFRYEDRASGHRAETSFGAHVFNTVLTYKGEPQSYSGRPPGLSTRLFLRLGPAPYDTICHLIYPLSTLWHQATDTQIILHDANGVEVARQPIYIQCGGSRFWTYHEIFDDPATRARAGTNAYIVIRDTTCRLFGYHGVLGDDGAFSLDHMFGF